MVQWLILAFGFLAQTIRRSKRTNTRTTSIHQKEPSYLLLPEHPPSAHLDSAPQDESASPDKTSRYQDVCQVVPSVVARGSNKGGSGDEEDVVRDDGRQGSRGCRGRGCDEGGRSRCTGIDVDGCYGETRSPMFNETWE